MTAVTEDAPQDTGVPKRTYERRIGTARRWLRKAPDRITPVGMAKALGWPRDAATKVLVNLASEGLVVRVDRGVYTRPEGARVTPAATPAVPADPYMVVDLVLDELFPDGIRAVHLQQVIEWRESTRALLELMEAK